MNIDSQRKIELARALSHLDRLGPADALPEVKDGRPIGEAFRIGITGPVGAGKSTLINRVAREFRRRDLTVGIIAVDPSSPFTGGAVLGDRVRMTDLTLDDGVFIRSIATRGSSGGLAAHAIDAADLLDSIGFDRIILETVGVGQTEVDIVQACDVTMVVLEPSSGDGVQAIKAGLMEIADLFVVNKRDLRGADRFIADIETTVEMKGGEHPPGVLATIAPTGEGVPELFRWLEDYYRRVVSDGTLEKRRTEQRVARIKRAAEEILRTELWRVVPEKDLKSVIKGDQAVREAARAVVKAYLRAGSSKQGK